MNKDTAVPHELLNSSGKSHTHTGVRRRSQCSIPRALITVNLAHYVWIDAQLPSVSCSQVSICRRIAAASHESVADQTQSIVTDLFISIFQNLFSNLCSAENGTLLSQEMLHFKICISRKGLYYLFVFFCMLACLKIFIYLMIRYSWSNNLDKKNTDFV